MTRYLSSNRNIVKIDLSTNIIGDEALIPISDALSENLIRIKHLIMEGCKFSTEGFVQLFIALRTNGYLSEL